MVSDEMNDVLSLLAVTIFADKRVFAEEIETFMDLAKFVQNEQGLETKVSQARLLAWFETNKGPLQSKLETSEFETWIYAILDRLEGFSNKDLLLEAMEIIAASDDDIHVSEKALIVIAARRWNIKPSLFAA